MFWNFQAYDQPDIYETDDTTEGQGYQDYIEVRITKPLITT